MVTSKPWETGLEQLRTQGTISGYALVTRGGVCDSAQGSLSNSYRNTNASEVLELAERFCTLIDSDQQAEALTVLGQKCIVYKQTPCDIYAISRRRRLGVCLHGLPFGTLVSVFEKPHIPQTVIPKLEAICSAFRV